MRVLSLFDGMSCGRLALHRAGVPVTQYIASEIDKYAIHVARANWSDIIHLGDVREVRKLVELGVFGKIDLLIGGSPCQGFSMAGKGLAFDDPRSALFFEYVAILNALRKQNPDIKFLLENVKMKKEHLAVIDEHLGVKSVVINSALVSAQNRVRHYWANWPISQPADRGIYLRDIIETGEVGESHTLSTTAMNRLSRKTYSAPQVMPDKTGTLNTKNNSDQLSFDSGTTLIPLTSGEMNYMNRQVADGRNHWDFGHHSDTAENKSKTLVANLHKGVPYNVLVDRSKRTIAGLSLTENGLRPYKDDGHMGSISEIGTIGLPDTKSAAVTSAHAPKFTGGRVVGRKINPETGKRDDYSDSLTAQQRLELREDGKAGCITTVGKDSVLVLAGHTGEGYDMNGRVDSPEGKSPTLITNPAGGNRPPLVGQDSITYRKLTPVECERLQCVPDNYTASVSNTQRYRMLGNGWTIEVIAHIFREMPI